MCHSRIQDKMEVCHQNQAATDELAYLRAFIQSIPQAIARSMHDLSEFVFITMTIVTLLRRDSCLDLLKHGIKVNTVAALRNSPQHVTPLIPDDISPMQRRRSPTTWTSSTLVDLTKSLTVPPLQSQMCTRSW